MAFMGRRLKVVILSPGLLPHFGGSAFSEVSLCASLSKICELTVLCPKGKVDPSFIQSYGLASVSEYDRQDILLAYKDADHWLRLVISRSDIFHLNGHWRWENHFFSRICVRHRIPYVLHPRGMLLMGHRRVWLKRLFNLTIGNYIIKNAAKVIALSQYEVSQFAVHPIDPKKIVIIPNGISMPAAKLSSVSSDSMLPSRYFLYIGRLESRKNLFFLLEAYARYRVLGGKTSLLFVGPSERGYEDELSSKIKNLGFENDARILPPVFDEKKWILMGNAAAVIYPSLDEPFGRVPFEAVVAGVAPIIPDQSGSCEYLGKFMPWTIYKHQDKKSLAEVLWKISEDKIQNSDNGVMSANRWVRENLEWGKVSQTVINLYDDIVTAKVRAQRRPWKQE